MIVVVAPPRSRSGCMMQSLVLMGKDVLGEFVDSEMSPGGNGEHALSTIGIDTECGGENQAIKIILDAFLFRSQIHAKDKVIYCLRSPSGVEASQGRWDIWKPTPALRRWNYWRLVKQFKEWMDLKVCPHLIVDTDDMIENPQKWMNRVGDFVGSKDIEQAIKLIRPDLTTSPGEEPEDDATRIWEEMKWLSATT